MIQSEVTALNHALEQTNEWMKDLQQRGDFLTQQQAYSHLRAVLHAVRDRLTVEEAVHFAAELPMMVRGIYFEGWRPALAPNRDRETEDDFLAAVRESLRSPETPEQGDLRERVRAVLALLTERMEEGQIRHAREQMPKEMQSIWPA